MLGTWAKAINHRRTRHNTPELSSCLSVSSWSSPLLSRSSLLENHLATPASEPALTFPVPLSTTKLTHTTWSLVTEPWRTILSRTNGSADTLTSRLVSSRISRATPSARRSPTSSLPPGQIHLPYQNPPRFASECLTKRTRPSRSTTTPATATVI